MAEQNNEHLMKNHQSRPTGSQPFPEASGVSLPEVNETFFQKKNYSCGRSWGKNKRGKQHHRTTRSGKMSNKKKAKGCGINRQIIMKKNVTSVR